jgi:hypothetical protein
MIDDDEEINDDKDIILRPIINKAKTQDLSEYHDGDSTVNSPYY